MTAITYTAIDRLVGGRSCLATGHVAGTAYSLETASQKLDPTDNSVAYTSTAQDGTEASRLLRIDQGYDVTTDYIAAADQAAWDEFMASVRASDQFTFDALGTVAAPDDPRPAILDGTPKRTRVASTTMIQWSFRVRFRG